MAKNIFISFRFEDGNGYKEELEKVFENSDFVRNFSENQDRSNLSEDAIKRYFFDKLKETSITIVILTPKAIEYKTKHVSDGYQYKIVIDDWLYDELKYSLEDRENNRTNGVIAIYTPETKNLIMSQNTHSCHKCDYVSSNITMISNFNNLVRRNMFNIKDDYKHHQCDDVYDHLHDHYISLVTFGDFIQNYKHYIDNATDKRGRVEQFRIEKQILI